MAKTDGQTDRNGCPPKPKRFLTAYNFFFMYERAAFLEAQLGRSTSDEKKSASAADTKPWTKQIKRKHVRSHGQIGFKELSQRIVSKWKGISREEKAIYERLAKDDLERYRKEMAEYQKNY
uniref:HMG box domain-containing protein n=1 Tax=Ditylum brightwellii TaxID=49249 RepID=A0A7S4QFE3_9STRA